MWSNNYTIPAQLRHCPASQRLVQWVERWQRCACAIKGGTAAGREELRQAGSSRQEGGSATVPVFQISHTEIGVQRANAARGIQSWLGLRLDDRWSPVRIALVSHQLTDLQACSSPAPPPPALGAVQFPAFGSHVCGSCSDATFTFHVILDSLADSPAPGGRFVYCFAICQGLKRMMMMMCTRRLTVYGLTSSGTLADPSNISNGSD